MLELNSIINQMDLVDLYGTLHPNMKDNTFFLTSHGTLLKLTTYVNTKQINRYKKSNIGSYLPPQIKVDVINNRNYIIS